jgi:type VI secretion system secreted protein VgrG
VASDDRPALLGNQAQFTFAVEGCDEELRVVRFSGYEGISTPFELRLELASGVVPLEELVGKPAVLTIEGLHATRHIHGIVCDVGYLGESSSYTLYELTLVPAIWCLKQRTACRAFQQQTTPQIIAKVLESARISRADYRFDLQESYAPRDYCVQYRESDLDFISRLMEDAGIYYYFEHREDRHVLVMTDRAEGGPPIEGDPTLRFSFDDAHEHISSFRLRERMTPQRVSLRDRNLHRPESVLEASEGKGEREIYDYPGAFQEGGKGGPHRGDQQARLRLESLQASRRRAFGESDSSRLVPGFVFTLACPGRAHLEGDYRIVHVNHRGEQPQSLDEGAHGEFRYSNEFECADRALPFRPPRLTPRPVVRGAQTATVVGPAGEEVYVDEHGRVKVQFHWDREAGHDENSSCWVRVSQAWAGNGFGAMFIPRIGHEVIVEFLEGDPDRPLVTGRVYTGINAPPYPLPDDKTKSTIKTESSPGGGGFNELRFEDAKGREEIFLHGQRDWNIVIEHDKSQQIGRDEARSVGRDERAAIGHDRTLRVGHDHNESIGGDMNISVGANLSEAVGADASHAIGGNLTATIGASKTESVAVASALTVGAAYQVSVGGALNESVGLTRTEEVGLAKMVTVGGDSAEAIGGGKSVNAAVNITESAGQNLAFTAGKHVNLVAGQNLNISAGKQAGVVVADKLTLQCGDATIVVKKSGEVTISAKKISVKATGPINFKGAKVKLN